MPDLPKKVLLIGNYLPDAQESMQRFGNIFLQELPKRGVAVELIRPELRFGRFRPRKWFRYVDKLLLFPSRLRAHLRVPSQVVHICDHSNAVYTRALAKTPHLVTCHDMIAIRSSLGEFPEHTTRASGQQYQRMILRFLKRARRVACVSSATLHDFQRLTQTPTDRAVVIHNGLNFDFRPIPRPEAIELIAKKRGAPPPRFLLHVGGNQWYKNRLGVLKIYRELLRLMRNAPDLILVGKEWPDDLRALAAAPDLAGKVHAALQCGDDELRAFYSAAEALIFPSLIEGFGWPVVEAQACGCRVAASNRGALPEVGAEAALYFDPTDPPLAARQLHTLLLENASERQKRIQLGLENSTRFAVTQMIDRYLAEYSLLAG